MMKHQSYLFSENFLSKESSNPHYTTTPQRERQEEFSLLRKKKGYCKILIKTITHFPDFEKNFTTNGDFAIYKKENSLDLSE
jgi:hypothetical protein